MALLVGGPKDGEIVEWRGHWNESIVVAVPSDRDEYPLKTLYHPARVKCLGLRFPVWIWERLSQAQGEAAAGRHLLQPLAFALAAEVRDG